MKGALRRPFLVLGRPYDCAWQVQSHLLYLRDLNPEAHLDFRAKLRRGTAIHRAWTAARRTGGTVNGVLFLKCGAHDYVSAADVLTADEVALFQAHPMIELEMTTLPIGSVEVIEGEDLGPDDDPPKPTDPPRDPFADPPKDKPAPVMRPPGQQGGRGKHFRR